MAGCLSFTLTGTFDNYLESRQWKRVERLILKGEYEGAHSALNAPWIQRPHRVSAFFRRGQLEELYLGRPQEALISYLSLIRDYPGDRQAQEARRRIVAIYLERLYDLDQAALHLELLIAQEPADAELLREQLADIYFRQDDYDRSRAQYALLARDTSDEQRNRRSRLRWAATLHLMEHYDQSVAIYLELLNEDPATPVALEAVLGLSRIAEDLNLLRQAAEYLELYKGDDSSGRIRARGELLDRLINQKGEAL